MILVANKADLDTERVVSSAVLIFWVHEPFHFQFVIVAGIQARGRGTISTVQGKLPVSL